MRLCSLSLKFSNEKINLLIVYETSILLAFSLTSHRPIFFSLLWAILQIRNYLRKCYDRLHILLEIFLLVTNLRKTQMLWAKSTKPTHFLPRKPTFRIFDSNHYFCQIHWCPGARCLGSQSRKIPGISKNPRKIQKIKKGSSNLSIFAGIRLGFSGRNNFSNWPIVSGIFVRISGIFRDFLGIFFDTL